MMKQKLLIVFLSLSFVLMPVTGTLPVLAEDEAYVRTRPIPEALAEVAAPYQAGGQGSPVDIRISLPEVLLNSADAQAVNGEIAEIEQELVEAYQQALEWAEPQYEFYYSSTANYAVTVQEGILSLKVEVFADFYAEGYECRIYNFDLESGRRLSDAELVEKLGGAGLNMDLLWEENIAREARSAGDSVEMAMRSQLNSSENTSEYKPEDVGISDLFTAQTLENFRENHFPISRQGTEKQERSRLYINSGGGLKMLYAQAAPAGPGFYFNEAPFYIFSFPRERELNPVYVRIMEDLGKDPRESSYRGLLAFVGAAADSEALETVLNKVMAFSIRWNQYQGPSPVLSNEISEATGWKEVGTFSEFYLLVPKYKNDYIEMSGLKLTGAGDLVEKDSDEEGGMVCRQALGLGLIGLSAETMPSGGLRFSNMQERGAFWYPHFSGYDGKLLLPEDVLDISQIAEENFQTFPEDELWNDENLKNYINWYFKQP